MKAFAKHLKEFLVTIAALAIAVGYLLFGPVQAENMTPAEFKLENVPPYSGSPFVEINNNEPYFMEKQLTTKSYELYGPLDELDRCTAAMSSIGEDLMPTEKRGDIYQVKPTGWHSVKYDNVDGGSLYNRCHLIGFQLTAENANEQNLITGTRYLNVQGMLPFENMVADYIKETGNHVLYRVSPIFEGNNLVASGVLMEGFSVEDMGEGICFNVYCYNVQPGIGIDYATGESWEEKQPQAKPSQNSKEQSYILNTNSHKFHTPDCPGVKDISESNRETFTGSRDQLIQQGYEPCGRCKP